MSDALKPRTFTDTAGHTWVVSITVGAIRTVRTHTTVELGKLIDHKMKGLIELLGDPESLCNVLFVLCKEQAEKAAVTDEDFGRAMGGDALEQAIEAFVGALADFSPRPTRTLLLDWLKKSKETEDKLIAFGRKKLDALNVEELLEREWSKSAGNSPASAALTPEG